MLFYTQLQQMDGKWNDKWAIMGRKWMKYMSISDGKIDNSRAQQSWYKIGALTQKKTMQSVQNVCLGLYACGPRWWSWKQTTAFLNSQNSLTHARGTRTKCICIALGKSLTCTIGTLCVILTKLVYILGAYALQLHLVCHPLVPSNDFGANHLVI